MDTDTGQIAAAALTTSDVDDASQVGPLLDQVNGPVASFTADGATGLERGAERHRADGASNTRRSPAEYH